MLNRYLKLSVLLLVSVAMTACLNNTGSSGSTTNAALAAPTPSAKISDGAEINSNT